MYINVDIELKKNKMTRSELAMRMHRSPSTVSLKLNCKAPITLDEGKEIKKILNSTLSLEELFKDDAEQAS